MQSWEFPLALFSILGTVRFSTQAEDLWRAPKPPTATPNPQILF